MPDEWAWFRYSDQTHGAYAPSAMPREDPPKLAERSFDGRWATLYRTEQDENMPGGKRTVAVAVWVRQLVKVDLAGREPEPRLDLPDSRTQEGQ